MGLVLEQCLQMACGWWFWGTKQDGVHIIPYHLMDGMDWLLRQSTKWCAISWYDDHTWLLSPYQSPFLFLGCVVAYLIGWSRNTWGEPKELDLYVMFSGFNEVWSLCWFFNRHWCDYIENNNAYLPHNIVLLSMSLFATG